MGNSGRGRPAVAVPQGNNFGGWLRRVRNERSLTGEALASLVGGSMTQGRISAYERGIKKPERETVIALAQALRGDPREALEALIADTPGLPASALEQNGREEDIALLMSLTQEQYDRIVKPLLLELARHNEPRS